MSDYYVRFTGYIDERKRPEGFPHHVIIDESYTVENEAHLGQIVNERFKSLVQAPGIVVMKDANAPVEHGIMTFDRRMYVPWHMITHFDALIKLISPPQQKRDPLDISVPAPEPETPETPKALLN